MAHLIPADTAPVALRGPAPATTGLDPERATPIVQAMDEFVRSHVMPATVEVRNLIGSLMESEYGSNHTLRLYGSVGQGLFVPSDSKVCIDVEISGYNGEHVLGTLCNRLQCMEWKGHAQLRRTVLLLQKTSQRPVLLVFGWANVPFQVTFKNRRGVETSLGIHRSFAGDGDFRFACLCIKTTLRRSTPFLGSRHGQISTFHVWSVLQATRIDMHRKRCHIAPADTVYHLWRALGNWLLGMGQGPQHQRFPPEYSRQLGEWIFEMVLSGVGGGTVKPGREVHPTGETHDEVRAPGNLWQVKGCTVAGTRPAVYG